MNAQSLTDAVSHRRGTFGSGVRQHDSKLVTTKPGDDVGFTRASTNDGGGFHERPASGLVPVRIVDSLETVEVQEQQRQRTAQREARLASRRSTWFR